MGFVSGESLDILLKADIVIFATVVNSSGVVDYKIIININISLLFN